MTDEREMLDCCKDCSYQCKQYDDLTTLCGCIVADVEQFGRRGRELASPRKESEDGE